jgi:hypothetical protein
MAYFMDSGVFEIKNFNYFKNSTNYCVIKINSNWMLQILGLKIFRWRKNLEKAKGKR